MQASGEPVTGSRAVTESIHDRARSVAFLGADGIVIAATLRGLDRIGVLGAEYLSGERSLTELYRDPAKPGFGYVRGALRCLDSQGWLAREPTLDPATTRIGISDEGLHAASVWPSYISAGDYLAHFPSSDTSAWIEDWERPRRDAFLALVAESERRWGLGDRLPFELRARAAIHLDGALAAPALVWMQARGLIGDRGPELPGDQLGEGIGRMLGALGLIADDGGWTDLGAEVFEFPAQFAVVSYLPMFARLPELMRGERFVSPGPEEWHVHRGLNVRSSAAAHRNYFADADWIVADLFDREPIADQPRFIADMGCGDGTWLAHLHALVASSTRRGERLGEHPLLMVGIDPSPRALEAAGEKLAAAGVGALLIHGDVGDPESLRAGLADHGLAIEDGLHIRSFLDHNRRFAGDDGGDEVRGDSSGAYVDDHGRALSAERVERDLVAHLRRWRPYASRYGIVLLEAHCVSPRVERRHLGAMHGVAFDTYHAYSHQYPVDYSAFVRSCAQAGLEPLGYCERSYPTRRPFRAISISRLLARDSGDAVPGPRGDPDRDSGWRAQSTADLADGDSLHRFLYADGDLRRPRPWASAATGHVVRGAIEAIESRASSAGTAERIRVLDYGTGTGFAAIELLKACDERGLPERGVKLDLVLADLPSGWFAKGHELLRECAWARFESLRDDGGGFRELAEVAGGELDVVIANMVFHLVPPQALARLAGDLAAVLAPGGVLVWSAPDLGPSGEWSVLFHDPNRLLRERWLGLLDASTDGETRSLPRTREAASAVAGLDAGARAAAQARAERRILPVPNLAADVDVALGSALEGRMERRTHEILAEEVLEGLLVPSNQREYLAEIDDDGEREAVVRELMTESVLPELMSGPAGTGFGLNLQWTFGTHRRP